MALYANEYQGGAFVELLSTQGTNPLANWKIAGSKKDSVQRVYDKALKGNLYNITGGGGVSKLQLPREEHGASLGLTQPFLVLQVFLDKGSPLSVECGICDAGGTKRRIILSTSFPDVKITPLHCQVPLPSVMPREGWLNVIVPLADLVPALFRGSEFRWLDALYLHMGGGKLRKIFTLRDSPIEPGFDQRGTVLPFPRGLDFAVGLTVHTHLVGSGGLLPTAAGHHHHHHHHGGGRGANGRGASGKHGAPPAAVSPPPPPALNIAGSGLSLSMDTDDPGFSLDARTPGGSRAVAAPSPWGATATPIKSTTPEHPPASRLLRSKAAAGSGASSISASSATAAAASSAAAAAVLQEAERLLQPCGSDLSDKGRGRPRRGAAASGSPPPGADAAGQAGVSGRDAAGHNRSDGGAVVEASPLVYGRRAISAQMPPRLGMPLTPQESSPGVPLQSPTGNSTPPQWPLRAQSGPPCLSSEHMVGGLGDTQSSISGVSECSTPNSPGWGPRHGRRASRFTPDSSTIYEQEDERTAAARGGGGGRQLRHPLPAAAPYDLSGTMSSASSSNSRRTSPVRPWPGTPSRPLPVPLGAPATLLLHDGGGGNGGLRGSSSSSSYNGLNSPGLMPPSRLVGVSRCNSSQSGTSFRDREVISFLQVRSGLEVSVDGSGPATPCSPASISSGLMSPTRDHHRYKSGMTASRGLETLLVRDADDNSDDEQQPSPGPQQDTSTLRSHLSSSSTQRFTSSPRTGRRRMPSPFRVGPIDHLASPTLRSGLHTPSTPSSTTSGWDSGTINPHRGGAAQQTDSLHHEAGVAAADGGGGSVAAAALAHSSSLISLRSAPESISLADSTALTAAAAAVAGGHAGGKPAPSRTDSPGMRRSALGPAAAVVLGRSRIPGYPGGGVLAGRRAPPPLAIPPPPPPPPDDVPRAVGKPNSGKSRLAAAAAAAESARLTSPTRLARPNLAEAPPASSALKSQASSNGRTSASPQRFTSPLRTNPTALLGPSAASSTTSTAATATAATATAAAASTRPALSLPSGPSLDAAPPAAVRHKNQHVRLRAQQQPRGGGELTRRAGPSTAAAKASLRSSMRSRVSEVELEEMLAMNGWDGFGVDEEDELAAQHLRDDGGELGNIYEDGLMLGELGPSPCTTVRRSTLAPQTEPAVAGAASPPRYASPPYLRRTLDGRPASHQQQQQAALAGVPQLERGSIDLDAGVLQGDSLADMRSSNGSAAMASTGEHHAGGVTAHGGDSPATPPSAQRPDRTLNDFMMKSQERLSPATKPAANALPHAVGGADMWGDDLADLMMSTADISEQNRLYTPPIVVPSKLMAGCGSASQPPGSAQLLQVDVGAQRSVRPATVTDPMLELLYDPMLNCYYDQRTAVYYELKV